MGNTWEIHIKYMANTCFPKIHVKYIGNTWEIHAKYMFSKQKYMPNTSAIHVSLI